MKISELEFEMEINGVDEADIAEIVDLYKDKEINTNVVDAELVRRGYAKIFSIDYDDYDEGWEDDEYEEIEKFPHKHHLHE